MTVKKKVKRPKRRAKKSPQLGEDTKKLINFEIESQVAIKLASLEKKYNELKDRLVACLSKDQIEIADICLMPPELYAVNWFEVNRESLLGLEKLKQKGIHIKYD